MERWKRDRESGRALGGSVGHVVFAGGLVKREGERRRKHARALVLEKQTYAVAILVQPLQSRKTEARLSKPQPPNRPSCAQLPSTPHARSGQ
jgi:hypothetical protein